MIREETHLYMILKMKADSVRPTHAIVHLGRTIGGEPLNPLTLDPKLDMKQSILTISLYTCRMYLYKLS